MLTADDTRARFSEEVIKRAEGAARLARNLGHPNEQVLQKLLRSGNIHGGKLTARDVDEAVDFGGKSVPFLSEKSVRKNALRSFVAYSMEYIETHTSRVVCKWEN